LAEREGVEWWLAGLRAGVGGTEARGGRGGRVEVAGGLQLPKFQARPACSTGAGAGADEDGGGWTAGRKLGKLGLLLGWIGACTAAATLPRTAMIDSRMGDGACPRPGQ